MSNNNNSFDLFSVLKTIKDSFKTIIALAVVFFIGIFLYFFLIYTPSIKGSIEARSTSIDAELLLNKINFIQNFISVKEYQSLANELAIDVEDAVNLVFLQANEVENTLINIISIDFETKNVGFATEFPLILEEYILNDPILIGLNESNFKSLESNLELVSNELTADNDNQNIIIKEDKTELFKYNHYLKSKLDNYTFFEVYNKNLIHQSELGITKLIVISFFSAISLAILLVVLLQLIKNVLKEIE